MWAVSIGNISCNGKNVQETDVHGLKFLFPVNWILKSGFYLGPANDNDKYV